ncbi:COPII-coated ER to Golgi transport vesicle protein Svp26 [Schizosaccharomyces osmophilus]|uniref:COPII-coated ER to Golgi transport vesicle protein Svp26 n=1 Tax=Schizosaccharomyces osmophilus TaxID=2545709 RepID=A0AAE9WCB7_9SCHI|nr:COPII-coated ER to Golgi transport vesicle protein Svp26 [Schizosaccharomyces osmophilus]WBW73225.1 COPII-coated ER to Golgi transport vesicle protein Svp26 [Schizosaccharomyces osmophilus]
MLILNCLSYLGVILGFVGLTLSIASALYYVSEFIEEHTKLAKAFLTRLVYFIMGTLILLALLDGFPFWLCAFSIFSNYVYKLNFDTFPFFSFRRLRFLLACALIITNHLLWVRFFQTHEFPGRPRGVTYDFLGQRVATYRATFSQVASFMGICVWSVPIGIFVSFTAADNALPTTIAADSSESSSYPDSSNRPQVRASNVLRQMYKKVGAYIERSLAALGLSDQMGANERFV